MNAKKFHEVILPMQGEMLAAASKLLKDDAMARDAVQDVFEVLWRNRVRIRLKANPQGLCMRAVRNRCLEMLRKKEFQQIEEWMQVDDSLRDDTRQERALMLDQLHDAIDRLPDRQQLLVRLKYLEGMDIRSISQLTGLSQSNVTTILSRACRGIRRNIALSEFPRYRKLRQ